MNAHLISCNVDKRFARMEEAVPGNEWFYLSKQSARVSGLEMNSQRRDILIANENPASISLGGVVNPMSISYVDLL